MLHHKTKCTRQKNQRSRCEDAFLLKQFCSPPNKAILILFTQNSEFISVVQKDASCFTLGSRSSVQAPTVQEQAVWKGARSIFLQWCLLTANFHNNNLASTKSTCHRSLQLPSKTWTPTKMVRSLERSGGHGSACTVM